jgi:hypothetical protein
MFVMSILVFVVYLLKLYQQQRMFSLNEDVCRQGKVYVGNSIRYLY